MSRTGDQSSTQSPQLPKGNSNILRGISENLSFHASPEAFIVSRIHELQKRDPSALNSRTPVRAKILNRNVAIISSYDQIQLILKTTVDDSEQPLYVASAAYKQLMEQFFPPPNLLLSDGCPHLKMRQVWDRSMKAFQASRSDRLRTLMSSFWKSVPLHAQVDLYGLMKTLSWRILLDSFLNLNPDDEDRLFDEYQELQEDLLRGQFSLLPVSVNIRFWQSPRSKGIAARKRLQDLVMRRVREWKSHRTTTVDDDQSQNAAREGPPFRTAELDERIEQVRDHVLMMTSSLAAKALASLLTAFFLNIYVFERGDVKPFDEVKLMMKDGQAEHQGRYLRSIYLETERLSPPIVGIMRRLTRDTVLSGWHGEVDTLLPAHWDTWLYFVGADRDPAVFGNSCMNFDPTRYLNESVAEPLGFGTGPKSCLGKEFVRNAAILSAELCLESGLIVTGDISAAGVKAWLGWEIATPEEWAADMKQLPTQRPIAPVYVEFARG